ncbi:MAG: hypothetical protein WD423_02895 [Rhodothermales bacterium]
MEAHARAGIDIVGRSLRYAEIEKYGPRYRLLRLGSCDFEFDVAEGVLSNPSDESITIVSDALGDVFSGSVTEVLHVAIHPPDCYSFLSPLPAGSSETRRNVRLQQEAALLAGTERSLHITADLVRSESLDDGSTVDWVQVLAVEEAVHERIYRIVNPLPQPAKRLVVSMHAAASTLIHVAPPAHAIDPSGFSLAIGMFPHCVEYVLCRDGVVHFNTYTDPVPPLDVAFFGAHVADRFGLRPRDIDAVYLYGTDADPGHFSDLESVFDSEVSLLNPLTVLDVDQGGFGADFGAEGYAGCIGAAL